MSVGIGPSRWPLWGRITLAILLACAGLVFAAVGMGWFRQFNSATGSAASKPTGSAAAPSPTTADGDQLTITVTGPAPHANITIDDGGAVVYQSSIVALPFSRTETRSSPDAGVVVTASGWDAPSVACRITTASGRIVASDEATGPPVTCAD